MQNFFTELQDILKADDRFFSKDGSFLRNAVRSAGIQGDAKLLKLLLTHESTKKKFFTDVDGVFVFNQTQFGWFINNREFLPDSYTRFKNHIGLAKPNDELLSASKDVTLVFPYKDCILEGGQTKEDQKRGEIFYNETLASEEIDRLLYPKAFVNAKRYTKDGVKEAKEVYDTDNFIIKGNNLLALSSLLKRYTGKIKCIYIDPPYNTGSDSFRYNDSFNHSSWLTFMKNRLEIAKKLLRNDGVIFVSTDDGEFAYLKVLMDEIFVRENFLNDIIWNSTKSVTNTAIISVSHTHNLVYFRDKSYFVKNRMEFRLPEDGNGFSNPDNDPRGSWKADPFQVGGWRPNQQYEIINPKTGVVYKPNEGCSWKNEKKKFDQLLAESRIVFGTTGESGPQRKRFLSEALERGKVVKTIWDDVGTTTNGTQHLNQMFKQDFFSNPKPESFIQRILELATKEGDIVLDFFAGSGTTGAVAHKMNRQYILVEQMDYIHELLEARLKKVIAGEQGGISESVNWQGGGSFVYCELAPCNQRFKLQVENAQTGKELKNILADLLDTGFISAFVLKKSIQENIKEYEALSLDEQRKFIFELIDKNMLYVASCDVEDKDYGLTEADISFTKSFYEDKL